MDDMVAWHYNKNGLFTVKSAYKICAAEKRRKRERGRFVLGCGQC